MEVKDLKVSIAPQEVLELVWQQINNAISAEFLDKYIQETEQGTVAMGLFEKYYMRSSNRATLTVLATDFDGVTRVHLAAGGGGQGVIFRFDWAQEKTLWNWRKMLCVSICWSDGLWKKAGKF